MNCPVPTPAAAHRSGRRARWPWLVGIPLVLITLLLGVVLFVPVDTLRGPVERQFSKATGYQVSIGHLKLRFVGLGLGLAAVDFQAVSRDASQGIRVPELRLGVRLVPLLSRRVEITRVEAPDLELRMGPAGSMGTRASTGSSGVDGAGVDGAGVTAGRTRSFEAPDIRVTGGRLLHQGGNGLTRLAGIKLDGGFRTTGEGSVFEGSFKADSVSFAPAASPHAPLTLPELAAKFRSEINTDASSAATTLEGQIGTIPARGTIDMTSIDGHWASKGHITMDPIGLDDMKPLFSGRPAVTVAQYDLGGRLENGDITFETFPDREEMEYRVAGHLAGVVASLPGKGRVIDAGEAEVELKPDRGHLTGSFRSGRAQLELDATLTHFADPHWTARIDLAGPLAEALRFIPPQPDLAVQSGSVTARLTAGGRFGPTTVPDVDGTVALREVALQHTSIAVPVERFDCDIVIDGRTVRLQDGAIRAGKSDARFTGRIDDYTKPRLDADIRAGTIDLAELFPATGGTATTVTPGSKAAATRPPVTGHITIDRMVRQEVTLTDVTSDFTIDTDGMRLNDLTGHAWGGTVKGNLQLSPKGEQALDYAGDLDIKGVHTEQLLSTYTPIRGIEGLLTTDLKLSGRNAPGLNPLTVLNLIGKGLVLEGSFVNLPVIRRISEAIGYTPGMAERIPFKTIRHSIHVQNGFADLDSFTIRQDFADWRVGGQIGLDGRLDCPVTARIAVNQFKAGSKLAEFATLLADPDGRLPIGFHLGGSLASPDVKLNFEPLLAAARKKAAQTLQDELKRRLEDLLRGTPRDTPPNPSTPNPSTTNPPGTPPGSSTPAPTPPTPADELTKRLEDLFKRKPKPKPTPPDTSAPAPKPAPTDTSPVTPKPTPPDTSAPTPKPAPPDTSGPVPKPASPDSSATAIPDTTKQY